MASKKETSIDVVEINTGTVEFCVLGKTPIILNRMANKGVHEILFPGGRKTAAQKANSLKHDPLAEYRNSPYTARDEDSPTLLTFLATAFKQAIRGAGVDIPGSSKAQLGRLMWVEGERLPLYGIPQMFMSIVRSADMNRTPDVRTRAIVPIWACLVTITFVKPMLSAQTVGNLLASAGLIQGVGDWRNQKGSGTYGQFELVEAGDKRLVKILKKGGRQAQIDAMSTPEYYDEETEELFSWFEEEYERRGLDEKSRQWTGSYIVEDRVGAIRDSHELVGLKLKASGGK